MSIQSDDELTSAFLQDVRQAFPAVYDRYSSSLLRFIYRFTGDKAVAEEILHDVFAQLLAGKFNEGDLKAWLFAVAKNRALNQKKRQRKTEPLSEALASEANQENELLEMNLTLALARAEKSLSTDLRQTWELRKAGMDYQQIAEKLAIPVGTVKSRFARLVEILRKEIGS